MNSLVVTEALEAMSGVIRLLPVHAEAIQAAQVRLQAASTLLFEEQIRDQRFMIELQHAFGMMPAYAPSRDAIVELVQAASKIMRGPLMDAVTIADELYDRDLAPMGDAVLRLAGQQRSAEHSETVADLYKTLLQRAGADA